MECDPFFSLAQKLHRRRIPRHCTMLSSSSSPLSPPFSLSFLSSPSLSAKSAPSHTRFSPPLETATTASCSYTCAEEPRLCLNPRRLGPSASLYSILEIPVGATNPEIKLAYRRLARIFHPDVAESDRKGSSAGEFMRIHAAYSTLLDPEKRAAYDRKLLWRGRPLTAEISGLNGYTGRNWETDQCW